MKKLRLKKNVIIIGVYLMAFALTGVGAFVVSNSMKSSVNEEEELEYVNQTIIEPNEEEIPVINQPITMIKPYTDENVQIAKYYYDYKGDSETQEKSLLYHENTYIQNTGMDFTLDTAFDVVAVLDGTVTNVSEDELLGTIVEIKHENDLISSYQSLSEVSVKKNDTVKQGQVIGKSGTNTIDKDLGNHLHFELYQNGQIVDPNLYFDKEITTGGSSSAESSGTTTEENNSSDGNSTEKTE